MRDVYVTNESGQRLASFNPDEFGAKLARHYVRKHTGRLEVVIVEDDGRQTVSEVWPIVY